MKALQIPKSFMIHGQKVSIIMDDSLGNLQGNRGEACADYNTIRLQTSVKGDPQPQTKVEQAFCHEVVHFILDHMESEKNDDEKFVNLFGNLLHQVLTTMEYK